MIVAGATGSTGRAMIRVARAAGWHVVALGRHAGRLATCGADEWHELSFRAADQIQAFLQPDDVVFSSLGASASLSIFMGFRTYKRVDVPLNVKLLDAARAARASRFIYVSLAFGRELRRFKFAEAHETVVDAVVDSGLPYTILRPTGLFSTFRRLWGFAKLGFFPLPGNPAVRSNPVHEQDVAEAGLNSIGGPSVEVDIGGPEIMTRADMARELMQAAGRTNGRGIKLPAWLFKVAAQMHRPFSPRVADMLRFYCEISSVDTIAPALGRRRMAEYYAQYKPRVWGGMHRSP
jgi:uncharacterized protein YbjT (DUF2867 family)